VSFLLPPPPTRGELIDHLVRTRIAGDVATARVSNLGNVTKMLARDPDYWFGVELDRPWTYDEVVAVMVSRVGIHPDVGREHGADTIDPELCVAALDAAATRLADVAARRGRVLCATGHPTGLLALYVPLLVDLAAAGCEILTPAAETWVAIGERRRRIRYVGGVATVGTGGDLLHTHAPEPMQAIIASDPPAPDLVIADHGWAGAAGEAGWPVVGFADTNDPALFVAAEQGTAEVVVPLDDNVDPAAYAPVAAYLLARLGHSD
jgi:hypothetical protein